MLATICFNSVRTASSGAQWLAVLIKALLLVGVIFGVFAAVVCFWAIIQQVIVGGALIALFGLVTFPRRKGGN